MTHIGKYEIRGCESGEGDRVRLNLVKRDADGCQRTMMIEIPAGLHQLSLAQLAVAGKPWPTVEVISEGAYAIHAVEKWESERVAESKAERDVQKSENKS